MSQLRLPSSKILSPSSFSRKHGIGLASAHMGGLGLERGGGSRKKAALPTLSTTSSSAANGSEQGAGKNGSKGRASSQSTESSSSSSDALMSHYQMPVLPIQVPLIPTRLLALFLFCWFAMNNGFSWLMFAPVTHKVIALYAPNMGERQIELLNSWQPLIYCLALVPMLKILSRKDGLRTAVILGAQLEVFGAVLKLLSTVTPHHLSSVALVHVGQMLSAIASPVAIGAPALLSSLFFPPNWRTTCTGLAVVSNNIGNALSYTLTPAITLAVGFEGVVWFEVLSGILFCVCAVLFMPHPPEDALLVRGASSALRRSQRNISSRSGGGEGEGGGTEMNGIVVGGLGVGGGGVSSTEGGGSSRRTLSRTPPSRTTDEDHSDDSSSSTDADDNDAIAGEERTAGNNCSLSRDSLALQNTPASDRTRLMHIVTSAEIIQSVTTMSNNDANIDGSGEDEEGDGSSGRKAYALQAEDEAAKAASLSLGAISSKNAGENGAEGSSNHLLNTNENSIVIPGEAPAAAESRRLKRDLRLLFANANVLLLMLMYAWCSGGYVAWTSLFDAMLDGHFELRFIGTLSFIGTVGYIIGGIVTAAVTDAFFRRRMKEVILFCCVMNAVGCGIFAASIRNSGDDVVLGRTIGSAMAARDAAGIAVVGEASAVEEGGVLGAEAGGVVGHTLIPTIAAAEGVVVAKPKSASEASTKKSKQKPILMETYNRRTAPPPVLLPKDAPHPTQRKNGPQRPVAAPLSTIRRRLQTAESNTIESATGDNGMAKSGKHTIVILEQAEEAILMAPGVEGVEGGATVSHTTQRNPMTRSTRFAKAEEDNHTFFTRLFFAYIAYLESFHISLSHEHILCLVFFCGFFNGSSAPVFFELVAEIAYPINEAISGNIMSMAENVGSLVLYQIVARCFAYSSVNYVFALGMGATVLFGLCVRAQYRRSDAHAARKLRRDTLLKGLSSGIAFSSAVAGASLNNSRRQQRRSVVSVDSNNDPNSNNNKSTSAAMVGLGADGCNEKSALLSVASEDKSPSVYGGVDARKKADP